MGKKKQELPSAPEFFQDPTALEGKEFGLRFGKALSQLDFGGEGSEFGNLQSLIDLDPEQTSLALQSARAFLEPGFERQRTATRNELANLGGLTGSGATTAFTDLDRDLQSQLTGITTGAALQDRQRALQNSMSLVGLGSNQVNTSTQFGFQNQGDRNRFNQQNFENQLALQQLGADSSGGLSGGIMGGLGGAALGIGLAPFTGGLSLGLTGGLAALGGAAGALGPSGTGGQIFQGGAGLAGSTFTPGSTAGAGGVFQQASRTPFTNHTSPNSPIQFPQLQFPQLNLPRFG